MFDAYRKIRSPSSILDVIEKDILQSLMQSFFFRENTGMTMLYATSQPVTEKTELKQLNPFDEGHERNRDSFNPFCKLFRSEPARDELCRECDARKARSHMMNARRDADLYVCHMGLYDLAYPVWVGDHVLAVLFAGQRLPLWDRPRMRVVHAQIKQKAPEIAQDLANTFNAQWKTHHDLPASEILDDHRGELEDLREAFKAFGTTMQRTVNAIYEAKLGEAGQESIVEINSRLSQTLAETADAWVGPAEYVLSELEALLDGRPLVFLVRRQSRFHAIAVSPGVTSIRAATMPVSGLMSLGIDEWHTIDRTSQAGKNLASLLAGSSGEVAQRISARFEVFRIETAGPKATAPSVALLVLGRTNQQERQLLASCCRAMAYPAHVGVLFDRMIQQQQQFVKEVTFTAHTLKTPLQSLLLQLRRLQRYAHGHQELSRLDARDLAEKIKNRLLESVADAMQLQMASREMRTWVDVAKMLGRLAKEFTLLGQDRGISVRLMEHSFHSPLVYGVEPHLRVAFSNLLDNAVKYSFANREVRISLEALARQTMLITICNYGVGFEEERREELFGYGARVALKDDKVPRGGSGLGLYQAKHFIEMCDGSIEIDSSPINAADPNDIRHVVNVKVILSYDGQ